MARSKNKTCLAILRGILGEYGGEYEFAQLIHRSTSWVKHASAGRIPLPIETAVGISRETGVCPEWLSQSDTTQAPVARGGKERFDVAYFREYRARLENSGGSLTDPLTKAATVVLPEAYQKLAGVLHGWSTSAQNVDRACEALMMLIRDFEWRARHHWSEAESARSSQETLQDPGFRIFYQRTLRSALKSLNYPSERDGLGPATKNGPGLTPRHDAHS